MALTMEKKTVEAERTVGSAQVQIPLRSESAPTGLKEAAEVLWEDARLHLEPATATEGGVRVEGTLYCQALYRLAGDSALKTASSETPISETLEIEGTEKGMSVQCQGEIEHLEAEYTGGRVIFSAALRLQARSSALFEAEVVESARGDGLETRVQTFSFRKLTAESSSTANLRDEVALPSALRARGVLITRSTVKNVTCEREGEGVRVGGEVFVEALVRCGVEERPVAMVKYTLPFEQSLSFPGWVEGEAAGSAVVKKLECQLDDAEEEDIALKIACEVSLWAGLYAVQEMEAVTDAYGTGETDVQPETVKLRVCAGAQAMETREDFRGDVLLQEGSTGVGTVLAVRAQAYVSEMEGDTVRGIVESVCLYVPAGREQVASARGESPFEMKFEKEIPANSHILVEASDADAVSVVSDRMEVRCTLTARCHCLQEETVDAVSNLIEVSAQKAPAALIIRYAAGGEELWDIAKKYRVRLLDLKRTNPDMAEPRAGEPVVIWS